MLNAYNLLKFVHVGAVTVWVGGMVALSVINARLARVGDPATRAAMVRESEFYGRLVVGPAIGVVLLAGLAMARTAHIPFGTVWLAWGLLGLLGSVLIGGVLMGRAGGELGRLATAPDAARAHVLERRLRWLAAANLLLLFSVIWAMVSKPTL